MSSDGDFEIVAIDPDLRIWLDPGGGITLKAVTRDGDPVELSAQQAVELARVLERFAELESQ